MTLVSRRHYTLILWDRHFQWIAGCPHSLTTKFSRRWWRHIFYPITEKAEWIERTRYPVASCDMYDHLSHWKYTITKYKIQAAVPTNTRVVLYAPHVKLFAHTHTQTLLLELLSLTDVDNNTAFHLSYFPRMIHTHLHYTYVEMFLNLLVLWFWCTLQIFLNADFSFTASHSLFKHCSPHLFVPKQLKREWHSPHEGMLDSPIHLTPQTPQFRNHHCEPCYPTSPISITIWHIILPSPLSCFHTTKR
jgi:hypothetical protein